MMLCTSQILSHTYWPVSMKLWENFQFNRFFGCCAQKKVDVDSSIVLNVANKIITRMCNNRHVGFRKTSTESYCLLTLQQQQQQQNLLLYIFCGIGVMATPISQFLSGRRCCSRIRINLIDQLRPVNETTSAVSCLLRVAILLLLLCEERWCSLLVKHTAVTV